MRDSRWLARDSCQALGCGREAGLPARVLFCFCLSLAMACSLRAQDVGGQENEFLGIGSVITVKLHDASGQTPPSTAVVKLFRGMFPSGQKEATRGAAEFVVNRLGEFTVVVTAPGYSEVQRDVSVNTGRTQVDVYLRATSPAGAVVSVPGKPLLAPKAREALEQGMRALKENKVSEAEKHVGVAVRLAPENPDVLYVQGVLELKKQNWAQAQTVLQKATQLDPGSARTFAALGMAFCDEGKYEAAIPPLEKSLQLDSTSTWQTRWALAKSYYHRQQYQDALSMSQESLRQSNSSEPEIALLVAQSLTAVERYEDAAQTLRDFLRQHPNRPESATARRWLAQLAAAGKIRPD
ncbi:MAG TPA: tetratricopeptide repeat protein [Dongiaceae bacterium]|nr:tetratricopeptide repeat protein [Dongiaceae bacterium]